MGEETKTCDNSHMSDQVERHRNFMIAVARDTEQSATIDVSFELPTR